MAKKKAAKKKAVKKKAVKKKAVKKKAVKKKAVKKKATKKKAAKKGAKKRWSRLIAMKRGAQRGPPFLLPSGTSSRRNNKPLNRQLFQGHLNYCRKLDCHC